MCPSCLVVQHCSFEEAPDVNALESDKNLRLMVFVMFLIGTAKFGVTADDTSTRPAEQAVIAAFERTSSGWSCDEVLLDDHRRERFLKECLLEYPQGSETMFCEALLRVRKRGGKLPPATARDTRRSVDLDAIAEIAARRVQDELDVHTDRLLVDPIVRRSFDNYCKQMLDNADLYVLRKTAINLRKARRLEPELVSRVTEWRREIREYSIEQLRADFGGIPSRPGVYLFRDKSGYLYIGQAQDLQIRLRKHLDQSDRRALAAYLEVPTLTRNDSKVVIELHIFGPGSPGEELRMRKAYESELIRSRQPRFNLAP